MAIALPVTLDDNDSATDATDDTLVLDGSLSFDPDDGDATEACAACTYKWEIVTASYLWLGGFQAVDADDSSKATVDIGSISLVSLVPSNGSIIEFQLTVTDAKGASDTTSVTYNIETTEKPSADLALVATLPGDGVDTDGNG